jgi:hypothetical protein
VRLALNEKTFRKETDPTYGKELHQENINDHNGVYIVDGGKILGKIYNW